MDKLFHSQKKDQENNHKNKNIAMKLLSITNAVCNDDLTVSLSFNDKTQQRVDIGAFIRKHPHPQYNKYLKLSNFRKMRLESGNIAWGNDLDFHLEDLHAGKLD